MPRDTFSNRLAELPDEAHLEYYRVPNFERKAELYWDALVALNRAQAIVLAEVDLLDPEETEAILEVLSDIEKPTERSVYEAFEGPYLYMEGVVIERLGEEVGGKLHTGRSRNDLYSAAVRIAVRERILEIIEALLGVREALLERASDATDVVLPAFTHSQPAQPITMAHYLLAVDHVLSRDVERLQRAFERTNRSPLGAAAIGGTGFPLDRERLADLSGFDGIVYNTYDAIASVDYGPETAAAVSIAMTNLSRVSQDFLVWSMYETRFLELSDALSSVSSIMPQKKNPGVLEATRGKASEAIGTAVTAITALESVPFGDIGETSDAIVPFLEDADDVIRAIRLFEAIVKDVAFQKDRMARDAAESFSTMTELADTLVREADLSFRQAHEVVARLVQTVFEDDRTAAEVTLEDLDAASEATLGRVGLLDGEELSDALDPIRNVARRDIEGGTAPARNEDDIARQRRVLTEQRDWLERTRDSLQDARTERRNWSG